MLLGASAGILPFQTYRSLTPPVNHDRLRAVNQLVSDRSCNTSNCPIRNTIHQSRGFKKLKCCLLLSVSPIQVPIGFSCDRLRKKFGIRIAYLLSLPKINHPNRYSIKRLFSYIELLSDTRFEGHFSLFSASDRAAVIAAAAPAERISLGGGWLGPSGGMTDVSCFSAAAPSGRRTTT